MDTREKDLICEIGKHERGLRAFIRSSGIYRPEDVDEVMQEVLVKAWSKLDQLKEMEDFPKWAVVIARYEVLNFRKKKARDRLVLSETVTELLMEEGEEDEDRIVMLDQLEECVEKLNPNQQELIKTAYAPGIPMEEVAQSFGVKANAIYQKLWRIRQKLAHCMKSSLDLDIKGAF